jgi:hypothetical protein
LVFFDVPGPVTHEHGGTPPKDFLLGFYVPSTIFNQLRIRLQHAVSSNGRIQLGPLGEGYEVTKAVPEDHQPSSQ